MMPLSYLFAAVHLLIVLPFTVYYVTHHGPSTGMEMAVPMLLDLPLAMTYGVIANIAWLYTDSQIMSAFHRGLALVCFPVLGTLQWFFIGQYLQRWLRKRGAKR